eukprot:CAMPEP_0172443504 /NCGR_PEP_ID=MMETSP1065-20121228/3757_1 /TAXON_ID=265537 /ORGANISM="Amphiprora paludosa, Strain CCMP125" /LENGTH=193 /DNA_ID=CAMNT_0013193765 /DNA_START=13 /DNA_END=594 /DNA_ORIENTATION=+
MGPIIDFTVTKIAPRLFHSHRAVSFRAMGGTNLLTGTTAQQQRVPFFMDHQHRQINSFKDGKKGIKLDKYNAPETHKMITLINSLMSENKYAQAAGLLEDFLYATKKFASGTVNPEESQLAATWPLANCYVQLKKWDKAEALVDECIWLQGMHQERRSNRAPMLKLTAQQLQDLKKFIQDLKRDFPNDYEKES